MALIFYTNPMSRGQIARWMLHEVEAEYEARLLEYGDDMAHEDFLTINAMGKIPVIVDDGRVVTECAAICAYLADRFPDSDLAPDPDERHDYYRWLFFAAGPLEQAVTMRQFGADPSAEQEKMLGFGSFDRVIAALDRKLSNADYVCGHRFTAADVYLGSHIIWGLEFQSLPERDSFKAYADRLTTRSAYREAKTIDEKLIAQIEKADKD